jgi:hypothetical protein
MNTYGRAFLLVEGLMLFMLKLGSRRQVRFELDSPEALENLNRLSGCRQDSVAHGDTLNHFLGHVAPGSHGTPAPGDGSSPDSHEGPG